MPKLLLLDGHSLAYRAFHALPTDLSTRAGTVTNAVYGFTSMLVKVLGDEQPDYIAVAFDTGAPTFRDDMDPEYKAGRKETPELFSSQLPLIREVLDALKVQMLEVPGVEADDVIATLATAGRGSRASTSIVVTGDRDTYQLVEDPHLKVLYNRRGVSDYVLYDEAGIFERCGVTPGAVPRLRRPARRHQRQPSRRPRHRREDRRQAHQHATATSRGSSTTSTSCRPSNARTSTRCATACSRTARCRGCAATSTSTSRPTTLRTGRLGPRAGARALRPARVPHAAPAAVRGGRRVGGRGHCGRHARGRGHRRSRDRESVVQRLKTIGSAGEPYALEAALGGASRGAATCSASRSPTDDDEAAYLDGDVARRPGRPARRSPRWSVADGPPLVAHRAKELMHGLAAATSGRCDQRHRGDGVPPRPGGGEVPPRRPRAALPVARGAVARRARGGHPRPRRRHRRRGDRPAGAGGAAAGRRARRRARARELTDLYERFERPLVRVLARMEDAGVRIDRAFLDELRAELQQELRRARSAASTRTPARSSTSTRPRSCARILFEKLGLTPVKKTKTGPSTDADSLQKMAADHPIVDDLLRYREVEKLRSTYADALPPLIGADGRIHAHVQADRHHHRAHLERGAQPPERPGAHRRRTGDAAGVHRRRGLRAAHRRLLADRAAGARAPGRGPGPDRRVRARRRHPHHHRGTRVRRRGVGGRRRSSAGSPRS